MVFSWGAALNALRWRQISRSRGVRWGVTYLTVDQSCGEFASEWRSALAAQRFHAEQSTVVGWYIASDESLVGDLPCSQMYTSIFDTTGRLVFGFAMAKTVAFGCNQDHINRRIRRNAAHDIYKYRIIQRRLKKHDHKTTSIRAPLLVTMIWSWAQVEGS